MRRARFTPCFDSDVRLLPAVVITVSILRPVFLYAKKEASVRRAGCSLIRQIDETRDVRPSATSHTVSTLCPRSHHHRHRR